MLLLLYRRKKYLSKHIKIFVFEIEVLRKPNIISVLIGISATLMILGVLFTCGTSVQVRKFKILLIYFNNC